MCFLMNFPSPFKAKVNPLALVIFSFLWVSIWAFTTVRTFCRERPYYEFAVSVNFESLQEENTIFDEHSSDYYAILKSCNQLLPWGEKIQIILPQEWQRYSDFLREKGRYILYPRNYGDNKSPQKYILVYQVSDFQAPKGCRVIRVFGPGKYLMKNDSFDNPQGGERK